MACLGYGTCILRHGLVVGNLKQGLPHDFHCDHDKVQPNEDVFSFTQLWHVLFTQLHPEDVHVRCSKAGIKNMVRVQEYVSGKLKTHTYCKSTSKIVS